jgi:hypothetical protein
MFEMVLRALEIPRSRVALQVFLCLGLIALAGYVWLSGDEVQRWFAVPFAAAAVWGAWQRWPEDRRRLIDRVRSPYMLVLPIVYLGISTMMAISGKWGLSIVMAGLSAFFLWLIVEARKSDSSAT